MAKKMNQKLDREIRRDEKISTAMGLLVFVVATIPVVVILLQALSHTVL